MPYQENELFAGRYNLVKKLGVGGFSEVWLANDNLTDGNQIAIKIYAPNGGLDNQGLKVFSKEYALLQDINNQYLLKAMHFDTVNDMPYLVLPYCPNGSLLGQLHEKGNFSEEELAKVIFEVCTGLAYLHDNGIIHQDIKPANILINRRNEYVISDFGISNNVRRTLRKSVGAASSSMSPEYAPPERFSSNPQTLPSGDVFSFGVLMYEMATGDVPWMGMGGMSLSRGAEIPSLPEGFSNNFKKLATACLALNPNDRPTAKDLAKAAETFVNEGFWPPFKIASATAEDKPKAAARKTVARVDMEEMAAQIDQNLKNQEQEKASNSEPKKGNATMKDGAARSPKSENKNKKKSPIVAIIIAVVLIGGGAFGGFWFMGQQKIKKFDQTMANAQAFVADSNWLAAYTEFGLAQEIIPENATATEGKNAAFAAMQSIVTAGIETADAMAEEEKFSDAMDNLTSLADYESLFAEIAQAKTRYQAKAEEQKEKLFLGMMAKGEDYLTKLTYAKAAEYFGRADSLKPGDARVQEKLNTIGTKLKELYSGEIEKGDTYMSAKNHSAAVSAYSRAVLYDKANADGKAKLDKAKALFENDKKLIAAAQENNLTEVRNLINAGASTNYTSAGKNAIGWAVFKANLDMLKTLKDAGANCNTDIEYYYGFGYHYDLISLAAAVNNVDIFKYLHTVCKADIASVQDDVKDGAIKDYMKSLGYGKNEFADYFSSESSSKFTASTDVNREWSFRDGKFFLRCLTTNYAGWRGVEFDIDIYDDWEVSVDVTHIGGNTSFGGVGLMYASQDDYGYVNVFGVTPNGKYHTGYYDDAWKDLNYVESSSIYKDKATNKLRIVKKGTTVYYYINGTYVTANYNVKMAGTTFGFFYGSPDGYTTISFDNLVVKNI